MTLAGGTIRRPEGDFNSTSESVKGFVTGRSGTDGVVVPKVGTGCDGGFCGKRGVVFALDGAPVMGGAAGFGGCGVAV